MKRRRPSSMAGLPDDESLRDQLKPLIDVASPWERNFIDTIVNVTPWIPMSRGQKIKSMKIITKYKERSKP